MGAALPTALLALAAGCALFCAHWVAVARWRRAEERLKSGGKLSQESRCSPCLRARPTRVDVFSAASTPLAALVRRVLAAHPLRSAPLNGHAQTFLTVVFNKMFPPPVVYERQTVPLPDGSVVSLDWSPSIAAFTETDRPVVLMLHGLTGGSHENYIKDAILALNARGFVCAVQNFRGCGGTPLHTPRFYSACNTEDLRAVITSLREDKPDARFVGVGFSLGANILTCYMGETGDDSHIDLAIAVANPWNLKKSCDTLNESWLGKHVYLRGMGRNLGRMFRRHVDVFKGSDNVDIAKVLQARYARDFDETLTCKVFNYADAEDYYTRASSVHFLSRVTKPFIALSAEDDPIAVHGCIPYAKFSGEDVEAEGCVPNGVLVTTARGGHLGWYQGVCSLTRWHGTAIAMWIDSFWSEMGQRSVRLTKVD